MDNELTIIMRVRDEATRVLRRLRGAIRAAGGGLGKFWQMGIQGARRFFGQLTNIRTLLLALAASSAIGLGAEFEASMAQVSTVLDDTTVTIGELEEGILRVGSATGDSLPSLTKALFDTISAGVDAGEAIEFVSDATKLALGGGTDTASAIKGLNAVLSIYGLEAEKAGDVSDTLFIAMKKGITTIGELSGNVGNVASIARAAGVDFQTMSAALSDLTKALPSTDVAATSLTALFSSIISGAPSEAREELGALADEFSLATLQAKGLKNFIIDLNEATGGNVEVIQKLIPNVRALKGFLGLARDESKNFSEVLEAMEERAGATDVAFGKVAGTLKTAFGRLKNDFSAAFISIVKEMKPTILSGVDALKEFAKWLKENSKTIAAWASFASESFGAALKWIADRFVKTFQFLAKAASVGKLWESVLTITSGGLKAILALLKEAGPVFATGAGALGRTVGISLVSGMFGSLKERLAKELATDDTFGGFLRDMVSRAGIGSEEVERLRALGQELIEIDKTLAQIDQRATQGPNASSGFNDIRFGLLGADKSKLKERRAEIQEALSGAVGADVIERLEKDFQSKVSSFAQKVPAVLSESIKSIGDNLPPEVRDAWDKIFTGPGVQDLINTISSKYDLMQARLGQVASQPVPEATRENVWTRLTGLSKRWLLEKAAQVGATAGKIWASIKKQFAGDASGESAQPVRELTDAGAILTDSWANFFGVISEGSQTVKEAIKDMVRSILGSLARLFAFRLFSSLFSGLPFFGADSPIQPRAIGGAISAGRRYLVGERGPEVITAPGAGTVIPTHRLGGGGGDLHLSVTFPVQAMDAVDARRGVRKGADEVVEVILEKLHRSPGFRSVVGGAQ